MAYTRNDNPDVSIVVASHRSQWIEELCERLLNQSNGDTVPYEIIIVTDYHNDFFAQKYPGIRWIFIADLSISRKRNEGIRNAKGKYIGFTDDDCMPAPDWICAGYRYLESNDSIAGVEGYTRIDAVENKGTAGEYKRLEKRGFRTNNIFYRKTDLDGAGHFDTRFSVQREDIDLAFTLLSQGKKIDYCKDLLVVHRFREGEPWDLVKNCVNRRFDPLLYKKHSGLYRQYIKSPFPLSILVSFILFVPFIVALAGVSRYRNAVLLTVSGAVLLTLRRNGLRITRPSGIIREMIVVTAAPLVLCGALLYGSVKFKKFLML
ncbi:MAG: glycosyltransferase family 2 protein [Chitinispirillaceae bacterium]|nr:glycosyltransferase family 2 protein [Chitinispirillaceae bacterium]